MSGLGHVVVGGHRFEVDSVRLVRGSVLVTFSVRGPVAEMTGHITVFGEDGRGVFQGMQYRLPAIPAGATWVFRHSMTMASVETWEHVLDLRPPGTVRE